MRDDNCRRVAAADSETTELPTGHRPQGMKLYCQRSTKPGGFANGTAYVISDSRVAIIGQYSDHTPSTAVRSAGNAST
jgi:hypothetical protein